VQRHEAALKTTQASSHDALNREKTDENRSAGIAEFGSIRQRHETGALVTVEACSNRNTRSKQGSDLRPGTGLGTGLVLQAVFDGH